MQRFEHNGRINVALMVRTIDSRSTERKMLLACDAIGDAREPESQPHAPVAEDIQQILPAEDDGQQHPWRSDDQDVYGNRDVGGDGPDGRDDHVEG